MGLSAKTFNVAKYFIQPLDPSAVLFSSIYFSKSFIRTEANYASPHSWFMKDIISIKRKAIEPVLTIHPDF